MKKVVFPIILTFLLSSFTSRNESEEDLIMQTMIGYVENWNVKIDWKYYNDDFLNEITETEQTYKLWGDSIIKGIHGGLYIRDSLLNVEGFEFNYHGLKKKLKETHKQKLKNQIKKGNKQETTIRFSFPIISKNKKNAIIYLNSFTNPLAASVELFILEKENGNWIVKNRFLKSLS